MDEKVTIRYRQTGTTDTKTPRNSIRQRVIKSILAVLWQIAQTPTRSFIENHLFSPRANRSTASQEAFLGSGQRFKVRVNEKAVQCWKLGNGPAILFVHGWNGRGIHFNHFFDYLVQAGHSAVIFDAPAHGESQGRTTSGFEFAETVRALLNMDNGLDIRGIIAHSLGAACVIMALTKQEYCPDAVLISPPMKLREILFESFDNFGIPEKIYKTMLSELEDKTGYDLVRDNPQTTISDIPSDFLIIHDREDLTVPYEVSKEVSEKSSNVTLYTTEGLGHKRILTDPSIVELAVGFFDREG